MSTLIALDLSVLYCHLQDKVYILTKREGYRNSIIIIQLSSSFWYVIFCSLSPIFHQHVELL